MLRANKNRITWFLGLQKILNLPGHSIAPVTTLPSKRRVGNIDSSPARQDILGFQRQRNTFARPRQAIMGEYPPIKRAFSSNNGVGARTNRRFAAQAVSDQPVGQPRWSDPGIFPFLKPKDRPIQTAIIRTGPTRRGPSFPERRHAPFQTTADRLDGSEATHSFAPIYGAPPAQAWQESDRDRGSGYNVAGTTEAHDRRNRLPTTKEDPFSDTKANGHQWISPDQDGAENDQKAKQNVSAVSTIHIDGSVLGRWAIQHFERALGKPATGMTGVDPRASMPRGRIAPF